MGLHTFGIVISSKVLFEYKLELPNSTPVGRVGEIGICAHSLFCTKFNFEQPLFEAFF